MSRNNLENTHLLYSRPTVTLQLPLNSIYLSIFQILKGKEIKGHDALVPEGGGEQRHSEINKSVSSETAGIVEHTGRYVDLL